MRGVVRPTLAMPAVTWSALDDAQRDAVLIHEYTHVRRGDLWTAAIARAALWLNAWNPAAWWLSRVLAEEREIACDDQVIRRGAEPASYAHALLAVASGRAAPGIPFGTRRGVRLGRRLRALFQKPRRPARAAPWVMVIVVVCYGLLSTRGATGAWERHVTFRSAGELERWIGSDRSTGLRRGAFDALGNLGANGRFAAPTLRRLAVTASSESVRRQAEDALVRIEPR